MKVKKLLLAFTMMMAPCVGSLAASVVNPKPFTVPELQQWKGGKGLYDLKTANTVYLSDAQLDYMGQYLCGALPLTVTHEAKKADIKLVLNTKSKLGTEGYSMQVTPQGITLTASTPTGILWGIQSLLQMQERGSEIPCGTATDTPDYQMRGFMIDCGRKNIPLSYLKELVKVMSYYKMNTLQVHLNDNGFKKYFHDKWEETYAGFRIESDLFPGLASKDGAYGKAEFRDFIRESAKLGVEIIPEFDAPAHALAFTHYRPSLACEEYGMDHLDLRNPGVIPFLDSLYQEYLGGPDPIFCGPRVHIGTDEYSNKDPEVVELFRSLTDHLIKTVESYGKQACLWGALTHAKGKTPVKSENVIMDCWYNGYANPTDMKEAGYQLVSIPDGYVYIVPEAGYYYNYLNCKFLYEHWTPAQIGDQKFEERDPQILGGMFALWNDVNGNGISVGDIHSRVLPGVQVIAQKTWHAVNDTVGYALWDEQRKVLKDGPYANEIGTTECNFAQLKPATALFPIDQIAQIGYDYQVDFDITWGQEKTGAALTMGPRSKFYLSDPIGGWLGFSRDDYLFTFQYKGVKGRTEHITIKGTNRSTSLLVDGKLIQELNYDERLAADKKPYRIIRTLVFPLNVTGNFQSTIKNFTARKL